MIKNGLEQEMAACSINENFAALHLPEGEAPMENAIRVDIFIAKHCFVCEYSHEVAAFIRAEFPQIQLRLIDMDNPQIEIPDFVFATPTYLLNGRLWSLGNPSNEDVLDKIGSMLAEM